MTREDMLKVTWKAYMEIFYRHPRMEKNILCLLIEIDFDEEIMTLQPLWDEKYLKEDFIAGIQHCSIPRKKMAAAVINGEKVIDKKIVPEYEWSTNRRNPYFSYENIDNNSAS